MTREDGTMLHPESTRLQTLGYARAAIDEMNKMAEEEHGVPMFIERESQRRGIEMRLDAAILWSDDRPNTFYSLPRDKDALRCKCGGYAEAVDSTIEECKEFGCGRDRPGDECCARAFVCVLCGTRYAGSSEAPEMSW
jgi:hypothetical protein